MRMSGRCRRMTQTEMGSLHEQYVCECVTTYVCIRVHTLRLFPRVLILWFPCLGQVEGTSLPMSYVKDSYL